MKRLVLSIMDLGNIRLLLRKYLWIKVSKRPYLIILLLPVVMLSLFFVIPLISLFIFSLQLYVPGKGIVSTFTVMNYVKFLSDSYYWEVLFMTLILGLIVGALTLIIGYPLAYFIARTKSKRKGFFIALVIFPLFINMVVRSYSWIILLANGGLVNQFLMNMHIIEQPIKLLFNFTGILIGLTHILTPFMVMVLASVIQNIETDYEEAAQVLGANKLKTFYKITLPLSLPGIVAGFLLIFLMGVTAFVTPRILGGVSTTIISNIIFQEFTVTFNWPFGAAMAFILLFATLVVILFYSKAFSLKEN
jgi:putative spermidine/putrescine transport system permease protein